MASLTPYDLLWHNLKTGVIQVWFMDGSNRVGFNSIKEHGTQAEHSVTAPWQLIGTGDFNRDGKVDLLWHNLKTGVIQVWFMDGTNRVGFNSIKEHGTQAEHSVTAPWQLIGTVGIS